MGSGANVEHIENKEIHFFKLFMNIALMNFITTETNKQYQYVKSHSNELGWRLKQWVDVTTGELYIFFALCLFMNSNSRNRIPCHWSTDILLYSPIYSDTMTRNRFEIILRMLHFSDNTQQVETKFSKLDTLLSISKNILSSICILS